MGFETEDSSIVVNNTVKQIVDDKTLTLVNYVQSLRDRLTSKDASIREMGINHLVQVLMKIPADQLDDQTSNFLLEFLLPRVEDSGHLADLLVTGIHHLILLNRRNLTNEAVESIMTILFEESGVQSYGQKDRMLLFLILEYLLKTHLNTLQLLVSDKMAVLFMRAANSERDPRCLLKIFQLFNLVVRHFPMGVLAEDMFEQVACYYPIDYEPNDRDVGKLSKEMLSAGCEACLLAHQSFGPFCFQLIAEKLVEEPGDGNEAHLKQQLQICAFLGKACQVFSQSGNGLRAQLEDLLTAFRLICLNPAQTKATLQTTSSVLKSTLKSLADNLRMCSESADEDLRFMAEITAKHCEPFVLQAEMGLTTKALNLLEATAQSSEQSKGIIVERVLYWLNTLMAGITIKSRDNRQEIAEETIDCLPVWMKLANEVQKTDSNELSLKKVFIEIYANMKTLKEFCDDQKLLIANYDCAAALNQEVLSTAQNPTNAQVLVANCELSTIVHNLLIDAFTQQNYTHALSESMKNFISTCTRTNFEKCRQFLTTSDTVTINTTNQHLCGRLGALIQDHESAKWASPLMLQCASKSGMSENSCTEITAVIARLSKSSSECFHTFWRYFLFFLEQQFKEQNVSAEQNQRLAQLLQDVGLLLDAKMHDNLTNLILGIIESENTSTAVFETSYLLFLQSKSSELLKKFISMLLSCPNLDESILLPVFFSLVNHHNEELVERFRPWVESSIKHPVRLRIWETRAHLLVDAKQGIAKVKELFHEFCSNSNEAFGLGHFLSIDLLDFNSQWADPDKCLYECTRLWRQRIMCQFVPVYVEYFEKITPEDIEKRVCLLRLVEPLLMLAKSIPIPMVAELKMITPMFTAALPVSLENQKNSETGNIDLTLLLDGSLILLNMTLEELSDSSLCIFVSSFLKILQQQHQPMAVTLKVLDCLEIISKKVSPERLSPFYAVIVQNTIQQAASKKRAIRQKSACVRNAWEFILG